MSNLASVRRSLTPAEYRLVTALLTYPHADEKQLRAETGIEDVFPLLQFLCSRGAVEQVTRHGVTCYALLQGPALNELLPEAAQMISSRAPRLGLMAVKTLAPENEASVGVSYVQEYKNQFRLNVDSWTPEAFLGFYSLKLAQYMGWSETRADRFISSPHRKQIADLIRIYGKRGTKVALEQSFGGKLDWLGKDDLLRRLTYDGLRLKVEVIIREKTRKPTEQSSWSNKKYLDENGRYRKITIQR